MKRVIFLRKTYAIMKSFAPQFFIHFSLSLNRKKPVMRAMRKQLNIFTLICYILEQEILIGAKADLAKTKGKNRLSLFTSDSLIMYSAESNT